MAHLIRLLALAGACGALALTAERQPAGLRPALLGLALGHGAVLGPGARAAQEPELVIDLGTETDADPSAPAYLLEGPGLSPREVDEGRTLRRLDAGATLQLVFDDTVAAPGPDGVPYRDAVLEVECRDVVDETDCATVQSTRAYCRPRLSTRLDFGVDRLLEWWPVGGVGGLADDQWSTTRILLEGTPWQTLRSIDGAYSFRLAYPRQLGMGRPLPLDRVTLRFPSQDQFDALREADRSERGLVRSDFVETASPEALPATGDRPYLLYARSYLEKVYPNSVPGAEEILPEGEGLALMEVAGESEPTALSIYATADLRDVMVTADDLVHEGGAGQIAFTHVAITPVGVLDKRWGYGYDALYGANPWVLLEPDPIDVAAGTSRQFWVTVRVPEDAMPGVYAGLLRVEAAGVATRVVPLVLEVLDIDLASPDAMPYLYHSPYLSGKHFAQRFETALRDMADHDIHPIIYLDAEIRLDPAGVGVVVDMRDLGRELGDLQVLDILPPEPRVGISDNAQSLWRSLCPGIDAFAERCVAFDEAYLQVLAQYAAAFERYGVRPALSFTDEPGNDPLRRVPSNYLNRLTRQAGMRTWVTYYPRCEEALAGHRLQFTDLYGGLVPSTPVWLIEDEHLKGYWDFTYGTQDRTDYANHGTLVGGARVEDGVLVLPDESASMRVPDADWLDLRSAATVALWLRVKACPSGYARQPLAKWSGTAGANYVLYLFGDQDGQQPDNLGTLRVYAEADGKWSAVSGSSRIDCGGGPGSWFHVAWSFGAVSGGTLLVNGMPYPGGAKGALSANQSQLVVGQIAGDVDDVLVLDRALGAEELARLARDVNRGYDRDQVVSLTATVPAGVTVPDPVTLSVQDLEQVPLDLETTKTLLVNDRIAWTAGALPGGARSHSIEVGPLLTSGGPNRFELRVRNGGTRREDVRVYWVDEALRNLDWSVTVDPLGHWSHEHVADPSGALGPMDPALDDRVYAMSYVSADEISRTLAAGDTFSYYSTYPATQPVPLNNRFLNGVYASAIGAKGVYVYAYGDWGSQPWDDTEPSYVERIGNATARRSQNNYELVLPAWSDRVYDTIAFEALREGVEDSRVIATLRREIERHPGPIAAQGRELLADLLSGPTTEYRARYMTLDPAAPVERYADRSAEMLVDLAGSATAYDYLDARRREMLRLIVALQDSGRVGYLPFTAR